MTERGTANLDGMVLWVPMLPADDADAATRQAGLWPDHRVHHWWDGGRELSRLFEQSLGLQGPAWDVYLLYRPRIRWAGQVPPTPSFWMHQLAGPAVDPQLFLSRDPSRLSKELDKLLPAVPERRSRAGPA